MSYQRPAKPRLFADILGHLILHGRAPSDVVSLAQGTLNSGAAVTNLVTGRVQERTSLDTSAHTTTDIIIAMDLGSTAWTVSWAGVLGHNLDTAKGVLSILHHTSAITPLTIGSATAVSLSRVVNDREEIDNSELADGDTVGTFTPVAGKRYWAIRIADASGFSTTDLSLGRIMLGLHWTAPYGSDQTAHAIGLDVGVAIETGDGGARSAVVGYSTGSEGSDYGSPFRGILSRERRHAGRRVWPVALTMFNDTDLLPADMAAGIGAGGNLLDVLSLCDHGALPLIATLDSTSTVPGDYMLARVTKVGAIKSAIPTVANLDITLEEEF